MTYYENAPVGSSIYGVAMKITVGATAVAALYGDSGIFLESPNGERIPLVVATDVGLTALEANHVYWARIWFQEPGIQITPGEKIVYDFPSLPPDCQVNTVFRRVRM